MKQSILVLALVAACAHTSVARGAEPLSTHRSLDWNAPYRWVHVDHIAPGRVEVFERARAGWLTAIHQGDSLLADGRPLFWGHRAQSGSVYFTFYPFASFAQLDARRAAIRATQAAVGNAALERYDSADSVLVAPHYTELWVRSPDDDYVPPGGESWTERTATCGWMETRSPAFGAGATLDSLWGQVRADLAAARYPLVCRIFQNLYGPSEITCLWLAPDSTALRAAPYPREALTRSLGSARATLLWKQLEAVFPIVSSTPVERMDAMSNLGTPH